MPPTMKMNSAMIPRITSTSIKSAVAIGMARMVPATADDYSGVSSTGNSTIRVADSPGVCTCVRFPNS